MIAEDLINHMIPPLKGTDDAHKAIVWMEEFRCNYLPVVDAGHLLGFISEEIILETNDIEKHVGDFNLVGQTSYVHLDTHFYDILKVATDNKLQMVAVLTVSSFLRVSGRSLLIAHSFRLLRCGRPAGRGACPGVGLGA